MRRYVLLLILFLFIIPAQAWQINQNNTNLYNITRFTNVTYHNNNSYPIILNLYNNPTNGLFVNNTLIRGTTLFVFVPVGASYRFNITVAPFTYWYEWNTTDTPTTEETMMSNELLTITAICLLFIVIYILYKEIVR